MSYPNAGGPVARPRPRPQKPKTQEAARESSAVRASVLDAALQLGFGANPAVADWMFSNTLQEEDEVCISLFFGLFQIIFVFCFHDLGRIHQTLFLCLCGGQFTPQS